MKMYRKILIGVLLMCIIVVQLIPIAQSVSISIHKLEVFKTIANKAQTTQCIVLNKSDWQKIYNKKEFKHHGEMFDVKETFEKDNKIFIYGYYDSFEMELISGLKNVADHLGKVNLNILYCLSYFEQPISIAFNNVETASNTNTNLLYKYSFNVLSNYYGSIFRPPVCC